MGQGASGMGECGRIGECGGKENLCPLSSHTSHTSHTPCLPNAQQIIKKIFQDPKQFLEKFYMSPTIEIAETHVSVHSSHHTPPGLLFGRFLMFMNKI